MNYDAIFLGSSLNELVCAAYLAKSGAKVLVLEAHSSIGGVAALTEIAPGFRAAVAPAEAGWLAPKIASDLDLSAHGLESRSAGAPAGLIALDAEGRHIAISGDLDKTKKSIATRSKNDADKWEAFASQMDRLAGFLETLTNVEAVELMSPAASEIMTLAGHGLRLRRMGKVDMVEMLRVLPMSLRDLLEDWFETDLLRGALSWTGMANLFQGPLSAGTGYTMLHHLAGRELGAFGSRAFPTSERAHLPVVLAAVLKKLGVEIRTNTPATVVVDKGVVSGVTLEGGEVIGARVVATGADPKRAFLKQLAPWSLPPEFVLPVKHVKLRGIRATLMLAVDAAPTFRGLDPSAANGVLVHASSLEMIERAFDAAKHGGISENPALEITVPSLHDASLAPAGKHVVHVAMQYAPYTLRTTTGPREWDEATRASLTKRIIDTLETFAPGIGATVVGQKLITPVDLDRDFGITEGNLYGGELTLDQILFMRPVAGYAHYKTPIPGYFVCGDATHPGGGMPGLAGHHAAARISKHLK